MIQSTRRRLRSLSCFQCHISWLLNSSASLPVSIDTTHIPRTTVTGVDTLKAEKQYEFIRIEEESDCGGIEKDINISKGHDWLLTFVIRPSVLALHVCSRLGLSAATTPSSTNGDVCCLLLLRRPLSVVYNPYKRITINTQPDQLFIKTGKIICKSQINCQITHAPSPCCHAASIGPSLCCIPNPRPTQVSGTIIVRTSCDWLTHRIKNGIGMERRYERRRNSSRNKLIKSRIAWTLNRATSPPVPSPVQPLGSISLCLSFYLCIEQSFVIDTNRLRIKMMGQKVRNSNSSRNSRRRRFMDCVGLMCQVIYFETPPPTLPLRFIWRFASLTELVLLLLFDSSKQITQYLIYWLPAVDDRLTDRYICPTR